ncbi:hypothetical protein KPH14_007321 [Odynerus spinipes]|uniref:U3 small nucleolar RNA-associated protein 14 homolog A n=1 Tax=Odynerus spinipes TaxID=1348599 RepID=A0AAD9VJG0_9HYME|nr:hypothetical protein KPH14_007321 [Odynerus spinipes]
MGESEIDYESDQEVSESHSKLLQAVAQLDKGQRVKKPERTEPTLEVSEFHLVKSGISDKDAVSVQNLVKSLGSKGHHIEISKKLNAAQRKTKLLPKPLEKPAADRIKRVVGFEKAKQELKKWNRVISQNRTAEKVYFPLNQRPSKPELTAQFVKRFKVQSDLEKQLAELEPKSEEVEEKEDKVTMTLEEIMERRKEAARIRAMQSYKEAKAHRQRKIKSKKFHRIQKKERIKKQLKEFEELQKSDPQAALEKLAQLDKTRAEERMSLRHKSTGQWAKSKQVRAKYDKETRQVLAQQLSIGRELTQKIKVADGSEDENDEEDSTPLLLSNNNKENPWVNAVKTDSEIDEFVKSYRAYWDKKNSKSSNQDSNNHQTNGISHENSKDKQDKQEKDKKVISPKKQLITKKNKIKKDKTSSIVDKKEEIELNGVHRSNEDLEEIAMEKHDDKILNVAATSAWNVQPVSTNNVKHNAIFETDKIDEMFDFMEEKLQKQVRTKISRVKKKFNVDAKKENRSNNESDPDELDAKGFEFRNKKQKPILDKPMEEMTTSGPSKKDKNLTELKNLAKGTGETTTNASKDKDMNIDPNKYINVTPKHLHTNLPNVVTGGDDILDDSEGEEEKHNIISEAFADDDVVDEFRKEKEEEIKKSQPEDIDLSLPGWGSWGGTSIKPSTRKTKQFIIKVPKDLPRKDENKGDVIIIEEENAKIREHQVNDLPFPFSTVKDFEASIRAPIGRNFVPENAHKKLIEPTVKTAMGKVIEPMNEDIFIDTKKMKKRKHTSTTEKFISIDKKKAK